VAALWPGVDSDRNWYQEYFLGGEGGQCVGLTTLTTFMCGLSGNSVISVPLSTTGVSRAVIGLLYLLIFVTRGSEYWASERGYKPLAVLKFREYIAQLRKYGLLTKDSASWS